MPEFDWRSPKAYHTNNAENASIAWEYLRRDSEYRQAYRSLKEPQAAASADFRSEWGLVFRR
ncbi:DUF6499 domain-containing protein [Bradyrhizobium sp.]|uniref:transcriptional regulator domain-containing protein n=1 Tax=Bradyrhizobium sp. TaxID=376 RepID=UPI0025BE7778|nr:DUF6499 domain-containing protein [Bradyrhizobium sp.]